MRRREPAHRLRACALAAGLFAGLLARAAAEEPAPAGAEIVEDEHAILGSARVPPNTLFKVPEDTAGLWRDAYRRAIDPLGATCQALSSDTMTIEGFHTATGFRAEKYSNEEPVRRLNSVLSFGHATSLGSGHQVEMEALRLTYFLAHPEAPAGAKPHEKSRAKPEATGFLQALTNARIEISGTRGTYDTEKGLGEARGGVKLEIFAEDAPGSAAAPIGVLTTERIRWRAWIDMTIGSSELALYTVSEKPGEPDPWIEGRFLTRQPDGQTSTMVIRARGMIFESSMLDRRETREVNGRPAGETRTRIRRAIFHDEIDMDSTGSLGGLLFPFQQAPKPEGAEAGDPATAAHPKRMPAPEPPAQTKIRCRGPCVMDLLATPRLVKPAGAPRTYLTSWRFEFFNGVRMEKLPLPPAAPRPEPKAATPPAPLGQLVCRHLCLQFSPAKPGESEGTEAMLPEYAEAVSSVRMSGLKAVAAGAPPSPFTVDCQRLYFDALPDLLIMEGLPGTQMEMKSADMGELKTRLCVVNRKTQVISMPLDGPKSMRLMPAALQSAPGHAPGAPASGGAAGALDPKGELHIAWFGAFTRETILAPSQAGLPPEEKDLLTFAKDVDIRQAAQGMCLQGQQIRILRDTKTARTERIEGQGRALIRMEGMQVKGEALLIDMDYDAQGEVLKKHIRVTGAPKEGRYAFLWQGDSAIKAERFEIDALTQTLQAFGGAVVRVNLPPPPTAGPKPEAAAGGASLMPGFQLTPGGKLHLQCQGELSYDGTTGLLKANQEILIRQEGLLIVTDSLFLTLDRSAPVPAPPAGGVKPPGPSKDRPAAHAKPAAPAPSAVPPPATAGGMFSGNVKTLECLGRVEITTGTQVVNCDHFFYDIAEDRLFLQMSSPQNEVRIYMKEASGGTRLLRVDHRLDYNGKTGVVAPESKWRMEPFREPGPSLRAFDVKSTPPETPGGRSP